MKYNEVKLDGTSITQLLEQTEEYEAVIDELFEGLDSNEDGMISKSEFLPSLSALCLSVELSLPYRLREQAEHVLADSLAHIEFDMIGEMNRDQFSEVIAESMRKVATHLDQHPVLYEFAEIDGAYARSLVSEDANGNAEATAKLDHMAEKLFADLDKDASNTLDENELSTWLCKLFGDDLHLLESIFTGPSSDGLNKATASAIDVFRASDKNGDGSLSLDEFRDLLVKVCKAIGEELEVNPVHITRRTEAD